MNKTKYFLGLFLLGFGFLSLPTFVLAAPGSVTLNSGNVTSYCTQNGTALHCGGITNIAPDTFVNYPDIINLNLGGGQLISISSGAFNGLSNLTNLELHYNQISSLPDGVFSGLSSLTTLNLSNNQISSLPVGIFSGLSTLTELYLNNNQLSILPDGVFGGLSNLYYLYLYENQISSLSESIFSELSSLNYLYLYSNTIQHLSGGVFSGLSSLVQLNLNNNNLISISSGAFNGLSNLTELDLYNPQLSSISDGAFNGLSSLPYLYLSNSQIASLSSGMFVGLLSLTELDLSSNQISILPDGVFNALSNLQNLYLNDNQISSLPDGVFSGLSSLNQLDISNNQLSGFHDGIFNALPSLAYLYLNDNLLTSIQSGVFNGLSSLYELYLNNNQIVSIETGSFNNMSLMTYIDLSNNRIDASTLDPTTLEYLNTRSPSRQSYQIIYGCIDNILANNYNPFATQDNGTCDDNKILNSANISRLCPEGSTACSLDNKEITSIASNTFMAYSNLSELYLYNNQLSSISSGAFNGLSNLTQLHLFNNQISSLPVGIFNGLSNLQTLNITNNQLTTIASGAFNGLSSLTSLALDNNCLDTDDTSLTEYINLFPVSYSSQYTCLGINYTPNTPTTGSVIGNLFFFGGTETQRSTVSGENPDIGLLSHIWTDNGIYNFDISAINDTNYYLWQKANGMSNFPAKVTWIQDVITSTFDTVDAEIESDGIISNLDQVDLSNYTAFSGLRFEKRTNPADANTAIGSITFDGELDLSDPATQAFLQDLSTRFTATESGVISLDFRGISDAVSLKGVSATIKFYGLDKLGFADNATSADILAKLNVYDDNGLMLDKSALLANSGTYVGACGVGETECHVFTIGVNHFTTYKISSNTTNDNNSHGGGGGGSSISKDICVNGDHSSSYYDGSCGTQPVVVSTGVIPLVIAPKIDPISDELIAAYKRAYIKDITTMDTLSGARIQAFLTRGEMAKMIVNYAINILGKELDTTKQASFKDLNLESEEMKGYINQAYQLGLMGVNIVNFNPQGLVTRGEFATVLARLLYGEEAKGTGFYYDKPIEILRQNEIIKNTNPLMQEVRGYVMLMLMRSSQ